MYINTTFTDLESRCLVCRTWAVEQWIVGKFYYCFCSLHLPVFFHVRWLTLLNVQRSYQKFVLTCVLRCTQYVFTTFFGFKIKNLPAYKFGWHVMIISRIWCGLGWVGECGYLSSITNLGVQVYLVTVDKIVNCVLVILCTDLL